MGGVATVKGGFEVQYVCFQMLELGACYVGLN